jgi:cytochrome P450
MYRMFLTLILYIQALFTTAKQDIGNNRTSFPKPTEIYELISPFGPNIMSAEGDEWKAQRKVVSRSFGEHNNRLVWQETCRAVLELFEYWSEQGGGMKVDVPHVLDITRELTLMVISFAGMYFYTWMSSDLRNAPKGLE